MGRLLDLAKQFDAGKPAPFAARLPLADAAPPWELFSQPLDPRERLTEYLDAWADMDEAVWPDANVKALYEDIMDVFRDHPEAESWFQAWRAAHPEAQQCGERGDICRPNPTS